MITIKPFKAWRPEPEQAAKLACVPYDVINSEEARSQAADTPGSFLHVIRPEIDFPANIDEHDDAVYRKGAENLKALRNSGKLVQDFNEALYVYRITMGGRSQTGLFTCVSVKDYDEDRILKHELTRPDKEDDRTRHIVEQQAHAEPVMLTCAGSDAVDAGLTKITGERGAIFDFTAPDGVRHELWKVADYKQLKQAFEALPALYVADGHHRCKAASRAAAEMRERNAGHSGQEEYNFFPAVVFPKDQMQILPYNRVIHKAGKELTAELKSKFNLSPVSDPVPSKKGDVCVYMDKTWYGFTLPDSEHSDVASRIDAARLQSLVFGPVFGIENPRTDSNISFIGGIRGTKELERLVDSGKAELAFSVYPTSIQELIDVSDAGLLMPPKSTWFEPKLRSGLLVHTF